jgi:hypothetical protein
MQLSVYWMIVQKVIVVYQPVAKEREKLFLSRARTHTHTHTQQKSDLQWDTNLKFDDLEPFENVQGPSNYLPAGCDEKDYFSLFVDRSFFEVVANETNKYAAFSQRKSGVNDSSWEETNPEEIEAKIGILLCIWELSIFQKQMIIFMETSIHIPFLGRL